jgi:O-antigen/teichoic acid export membrane protein
MAQVAISLVATATGVWGMVLGFGLGRISGALWRPKWPSAAHFVRARAWQLLVRYRRFPLVSTWSALASAVGQMSLVLVVGAGYGESAAGQFALTFRVLGAPVALLTFAFAQVFLGRVTGLASLRDDPALYNREVRRAVLDTSGKLIVVGSAPIALLCLVSPWLFPRLFGPEWTQAGELALALGPMLVTQVVVSPVSQVLNIREQQGRLLAWDVSRVVVILGLPLILAAAGVSLVPAIGATSVLVAVAYAILWLLVARVPRDTHV